MPSRQDRDIALQGINSLFEQADVDLDTFEARAIDPNSNFIQECIAPALENVAAYFQKLEARSKGGKVAPAVIKKELEFLQALAEVSPSFAAEMKRAHLFDVESKQLLANATQLKNLKAFLDFALQTTNLKRFHEELASAMQTFYKRQNEAARAKARELKDTYAKHHETARSELKDLGKVAIANMRSNEMFDPIKVIGHILSGLFYVLYKAPMQNALYPNVKHTYTPINPENDERRKLMMERYGSLNAPDAGAAPTAMPTPAMRPGMMGGS